MRIFQLTLVNLHMFTCTSTFHLFTHTYLSCECYLAHVQVSMCKSPRKFTTAFTCASYHVQVTWLAGSLIFFFMFGFGNYRNLCMARCLLSFCIHFLGLPQIFFPTFYRGVLIFIVASRRSSSRRSSRCIPPVLLLPPLLPLHHTLNITQLTSHTQHHTTDITHSTAHNRHHTLNITTDITHSISHN